MFVSAAMSGAAAADCAPFAENDAPGDAGDMKSGEVTFSCFRNI
ncbi:MAG TPA: hypothetical protein VGP22_01250 [Albitalea sp.]|nr:hypothetical protein [Albitalea sp.]